MSFWFSAFCINLLQAVLIVFFLCNSIYFLFLVADFILKTLTTKLNDKIKALSIYSLSMFFIGSSPENFQVMLFYPFAVFGIKIMKSDAREQRAPRFSASRY